MPAIYVYVNIDIERCAETKINGRAADEWHVASLPVQARIPARSE